MVEFGRPLNQEQFQEISLQFEWPKPWLGLDEVGRGCLAGPVVVAGAIPLGHLSQSVVGRCQLFCDSKQTDDPTLGYIDPRAFFSAWIKKVKVPHQGEEEGKASKKTVSPSLSFKDSKLLTDHQRRRWLPLIFQHFHVALAFSTPAEIDEHNILQATLRAMKRVVAGLSTQVDLTAGVIFVDGVHALVLEDELRQVPLIKGDGYFAPISAASIVAKVFRDDWMVELGALYPEYSFHLHKGYPSAPHREALKRYGSSPVHRRTFQGVVGD